MVWSGLIRLMLDEPDTPDLNLLFMTHFLHSFRGLPSGLMTTASERSGRFRIGPPQVALNLLLPQFHSW